MSDFDDLRQIREARLTREAVREQKRLEDQRQRQERMEVAGYALNDMVSGALHSLWTALYENEEEWIFGPDVNLNSVTWRISDGHVDWIVKVILEFTKSGEPRRFVCRRGRYRARCGLTREDLIRALKKIHPPASIK